MMSKKEIGMIALAGAGIIGVGYFMGGDALGGGGERAGKILGSPGAVGLPSTGVSSAKLAGAIGGEPTGAYSIVTPQIREEFGAAKVKRVPSKTRFVGRQVQVSPTYIPEAATQAYIANAGSSYVAPTFVGRVGTIGAGGSSYTPPAGLYPSAKTATGGLTAKGIATKKKVEARQASGFTAYSGKTPSSGYAAALARSG